MVTIIFNFNKGLMPSFFLVSNESILSQLSHTHTHYVFIFIDSF
jgi:hypothetical protein